MEAVVLSCCDASWTDLQVSHQMVVRGTVWACSSPLLVDISSVKHGWNFLDSVISLEFSVIFPFLAQTLKEILFEWQESADTKRSGQFFFAGSSAQAVVHQGLGLSLCFSGLDWWCNGSSLEINDFEKQSYIQGLSVVFLHGTRPSKRDSSL